MSHSLRFGGVDMFIKTLDGKQLLNVNFVESIEVKKARNTDDFILVALTKNEAYIIAKSKYESDMIDKLDMLYNGKYIG